MESFVGEIKLVPYAAGRIPRGWLPCDGSILNIKQHVALFSLLGITYGGDGKTTFALPDLRGRVPVNQSPSAPLGTSAGMETVTLTASEIPSHTHSLLVSTAAANQPGTGNAIYAQSPSATPIYGAPSSLVALAQAKPELASEGGGGSHENRQPYLALSYIICETGTFPPRP